MSDRTSNSPSRKGNAPTFEFEPEQLEPFRCTGYELIRLNAPNELDAQGRSVGKVPGKGWRSATPLDVDEARDCLMAGANVGVRLRETDLVVDVDPRNFKDGDKPVARLEAELGIKFDQWPRVDTGSDGLHFYMTVPAGFRAVDTLKDYPGIEFKAYGRQMVAPGSSHPDTGKPYRWDPLAEPVADAAAAPDALLELIRRPDLVAFTGSGECSPDAIELMLTGLDPSNFRDETAWRELMMACHHASAGEAREEFIAWSISDPNYADHESVIGRRWDSLHGDDSGSRVTAKTLFKALHAAGKGDLIDLATRASAAEDFADEGFADFVPPQPDEEKRPAHRLAEEWVWVTKAEQFINRTDCRRLSPFQFKSHYQHLWKGDILAEVWKGKLPIRKYAQCVYVPGEGEVIAGGKWDGAYNTWRQGGVEPRRDDAQAQAFLDHMEYLLPDETERGYALDYLSFLVADDAQKVHFAMLLQGEPGSGKSFIGELMERMVGIRNVRMVKSQELTKEYTGWQEDAQIAVVEEIMAFGRREVANELKTVITGDELRIRRMRTDTYEVPNRLNLICFTNYKDALPIDPGDRRWLTLFSPAKPRDVDYYTALFDRLKDDGFPAAVKWMLQNRVTKLSPKGVAPMTVGKAEMRCMSVGDLEQYLDELMEERAGYLAYELVRLDDVWAMVKRDFKATRNGRNRVIEWLKSKGARQHSRYTKKDESGRYAYALWSLENHDDWERAGPAARIDAWTKHWEG